MEMVECTLGISSPEEFHRDRSIPKYKARLIVRSMVLAHAQHVWGRKGAISHKKVRHNTEEADYGRLGNCSKLR